MKCVSGLYERIKAGNASLAVIGLGYVGMPLAVAFSKHANVIGYDTNKSKIELYKGVGLILLLKSEMMLYHQHLYSLLQMKAA